MQHPDFLIVGAGIFGITTAIELRKKNYAVSVINPGKIPHPLAESTDISKIVRMEYGSDMEYMEMVEECLPVWREWNKFFNEPIFHEVGFLLISKKRFEDAPLSFENTSYQNLLIKGYKPERLSMTELSERFPAINHNIYTDGFYHSLGGYAESGKLVGLLTNYARQLGCRIFEEQTAAELVTDNNIAVGIKTSDGNRYEAGHTIVSAGNLTPFLLHDLKPYLKITGQPVFHLKPTQPGLFTYPKMAVLAADISQTGWYNFPIHPTAGVVKVANHGMGIDIKNPEKNKQTVETADINMLKNFLAETLPSLANDEINYTRLCCYTDTQDGHFWIDNHPEIKNLTIATGGSGHAFKMAPVLGDMIATVAEGGHHKWSARHRWRNLKPQSSHKEEARYTGK